MTSDTNYKSYLDLANRSYTLTYKVTDGTASLGPGVITIGDGGADFTYTIYVVNLAASDSLPTLTIPTDPIFEGFQGPFWCPQC